MISTKMQYFGYYSLHNFWYSEVRQQVILFLLKAKMYWQKKPLGLPGTGNFTVTKWMLSVSELTRFGELRNFRITFFVPYHRKSMSESMDTMICHEDIIVETVSSTIVIKKGKIVPPIASSKQTEDITTKKGRKRRNTDISDIKLSC